MYISIFTYMHATRYTKVILENGICSETRCTLFLSACHACVSRPSKTQFHAHTHTHPSSKKHINHKTNKPLNHPCFLCFFAEFFVGFFLFSLLPRHGGPSGWHDGALATAGCFGGVFLPSGCSQLGQHTGPTCRIRLMLGAIFSDKSRGCLKSSGFLRI